MFKPYSRPFDPTGSSLQNLIINEHRPLKDDTSYVFVPSHGPFYSDSLVVTAMGKTLVRDKDYQCILLHTPATVETASEITVAIKILKLDVSECWISYQAVGGKYQRLAGLLEVARGALGRKVLTPIRWSDIINKPLTFNPAAHYHPYWEFDGWEKLIPSLNKIYHAIIAKKMAKYEMLMNYADNAFISLDNEITGQLQAARANVNDALRKMTPPIGTLTYSTKDLSFTDGNWKRVEKDTLLFATKLDSNIGKEWNVSEEMVPPFPDNVLLDEENNFIMRDDEQFIFLDNEHPTKLKVSDYWEEVDELFDSTTVRLYQKTDHIRIQEFSFNDIVFVNGTATINVQTQGFEPLTKFNYRIKGIRQEHLENPLEGEWSLNENGVLNVELRLLENSLPQVNKTLSITVDILDELTSADIPYRINSSTIGELSNSWASSPLNAYNDGTFYTDSSINLRLIADDYSKDTESIKLKAIKVPGSFKLLHRNNTVTEHRLNEIVTVNINAHSLSVLSMQATAVGQLQFEIYNNQNQLIATTEVLEIEPMAINVDIVDSLTFTPISEVKLGSGFKVRVEHKRDTLMMVYKVGFDNSEMALAVENRELTNINMGLNKTGYSETYRIPSEYGKPGNLSIVVSYPDKNFTPITLNIPVN